MLTLPTIQRSQSTDGEFREWTSIIRPLQLPSGNVPSEGMVAVRMIFRKDGVIVGEPIAALQRLAARSREDIEQLMLDLSHAIVEIDTMRVGRWVADTNVQHLGEQGTCGGCGVSFPTDLLSKQDEVHVPVCDDCKPERTPSC